MSGTCLNLDLAGNIGWSLFAPPTDPPTPPRFGSHNWRGDGAPAILGKFGDWLHDFYMVSPWDAMAWEEPWLQPGDKVEKMKILIGLPAVCLAFANSRRHPMPFLTVTPKEVKKRMTGRQDAEKVDVINACWSIGWKVKSSDEADACGVGLISYRRIWPRPVAA